MGSLIETKDLEVDAFLSPFPKMVWLCVDMATILIVHAVLFQIKIFKINEEIIIL